LLSYVAHDARFLLLRVAFAENLSEDTNGGGLESNLKLLVPLLQMGSYLLDTDRSQRAQAEAFFQAFVEREEPCADVAFMAVLSLLLAKPEVWEAKRGAFAKVRACVRWAAAGGAD
jgi:hypothetical protein